MNAVRDVFLTWMTGRKNQSRCLLDSEHRDNATWSRRINLQKWRGLHMKERERHDQKREVYCSSTYPSKKKGPSIVEKWAGGGGSIAYCLI